jgi:hypothetical protein
LYKEPAAQHDKQCVLAAVSVDMWALKAACSALKNDPDVVCAAVRFNANAFASASHALKNDKMFILKLLAINPRLLTFVSGTLRDDPEVVFASVQREGNELCNASLRLQSDKTLCMLAFKTSSNIDVLESYGMAAPYIWWVAERRTNTRLADDALTKPMQESSRAFVLSVAASSRQEHKRELWRIHISLMNAHESWKRDKEVVMLAIERDGLQFASVSLLQDKTFVLEAVSVHGLSLRNAPSFQADKDVVLAAAAQHFQAFFFAHKSLQTCKDVALEVVSGCRNSYDFLRSLHLQANPLADDTDIVIAALKQDGMALSIASSCFCSDPEVVLTAVRQNKDALQHAHPSLLSNKEFLLTALAIHDAHGGDYRYYLHNLCNSLWFDEDIIRVAVKYDKYVLQTCNLLNENMRNSQAIAEYACSCHGYRALDMVPQQLLSEQVIRAAISASAPKISLPALIIDRWVCDVQKLAQHYVTCCIEKHVPLDVIMREAQQCSKFILCIQIMNQLSVLT